MSETPHRAATWQAEVFIDGQWRPMTGWTVFELPADASWVEFEPVSGRTRRRWWHRLSRGRRHADLT